MTITYGRYGRHRRAAQITAHVPPVLTPVGRHAASREAVVEIRLMAGAVMSLQIPRSLWGKPQGMILRCVSGTLWVTQQGDSRDYLLDAGETFQTTNSGKVVIQARAKATVGFAQA